MAVALDLEERLDADAPRPADATQVVATEVDQHHVLGPLLGVGQQLLRHRRVLRRVAAAPAGAGDRARGDAPPLLADQHLGRGPHQRALGQLEQHHVRARVHPPQRAIERHRRSGRETAEPAREDDLKDVAGGDPLFGTHDRGAELLAAEAHAVGQGRCRRALRQTHGARRRGARERLFEPVERRLRVGGAGLALDLVGDQQQLLLRVIEGDDGVEQAEGRERQAPRIGRAPGQPLDRAHEVEAEGADEAARERHRRRRGRTNASTSARLAAIARRPRPDGLTARRARSRAGRSRGAQGRAGQRRGSCSAPPARRP